MLLFYEAQRQLSAVKELWKAFNLISNITLKLKLESLVPMLEIIGVPVFTGNLSFLFLVIESIGYLRQSAYSCLLNSIYFYE
jgi:hypothetical protein